MFKKIIKPEYQSINKKISNYNKHIRIGNACKNPIEKLTHFKKAQKLAEKYSKEQGDSEGLQSS